jgi:7-carboxy-7-deazaguanine synthase
LTVDQVLVEVRALGCRLVELTGGEPLLQPDAIPLMEGLIGEGFEVLLETGGQMPIDDVPDEVVTILDVKCPGSAEADRMHWGNLSLLSHRDEVKFVIRDRQDFDYALAVVRKYDLPPRVNAVLFSPVFAVLPPDQLARWILAAAAPVRLQLQVHKYIWAPETRGV